MILGVVASYLSYLLLLLPLHLLPFQYRCFSSRNHIHTLPLLMIDDLRTLFSQYTTPPLPDRRPAVRVIFGLHLASSPLLSQKRCTIK